MMFDLNLSMDCNGKADHSELQQSPATSISSVVDGGGETSSSNDDAYSARAASPGAAVTLNFDIVGGYGESDRDRDRGLTPAEAGLVTRELFPVSRLGELNLGKQISDPVSLHGPTRMSVQPQQQPVQHVQAKKSRRGPRSRSSQYRGVTFYRRTGRWESHIWYNFQFF